MIKQLTLLMLFALAVQTSYAQFKPLEQASSLKFNIKNLGFNVEGSISGFAGTINFDPQNPTAGSFDVTVNAATINTDNSLRDGHLKEEFFEVKTFPLIRLTSTKIMATNKSNTYMLNAQLTMKGKSKPVSFLFTATPNADSYVFKGSFKTKRKDFGVGGTSTVADELEVLLNVTAKKGTDKAML
jgi:polyisoprenoid-binding protein YceI